MRIIICVVLLACFASSAAIANTPSIDKLYQVDQTGWMKKKVPYGFGFQYECIPCKRSVTVTILVGPVMNNTTILKFKEFERKLSDKKFAKPFFRKALEKQSPMKNSKITIGKVTIGTFFNLKMFEYQSTLETNNIPAYSLTSFLGLQVNRKAGITIFYDYGSLDKTAKKALNHFMGSLKFRTTSVPKVTASQVSTEAST